ncbi:MAG: hypothetical protein HOV80_18940 [Polyangiaceae bacterium]|nr:hypothetical protein [Polyangiaceae bacterium]
MKRVWLRRAAIGAVLLAGIAFIAPELSVRVTRSRAADCLAGARAPRGPALPDCSHLVDDFELPAKVSYTRHDATYRAEELYARIAMNRYLDAAVGSPDPDRLHATSFGVQRAQKVIEDGSQRISLEELGPVIGSPHLGKMAASIGDRTALLRQPDFYGHWSVRVLVLEAALLEGDVDLSGDIAEGYADWDPRDADLRTSVGATLCITNPRRGLEILDRVPKDRADRRYANIQRNFGEVSAVIAACAAKLGQDPPPLPPLNGAGEPDADDVRLIGALQLVEGEERRDTMVDRAIDRLQGDGSAGVEPSVPYARAMLLAAVLAGPNELEPAVLVNLATPRPHEGAFAPKHLTLVDIFDQAPGIQPRLPARTLDRAAASLRQIAERAGSSEHRPVLDGAAAGLLVLAAAEKARAGLAADAATTAELAARWQGLGPRVAALSSASAAYAAGDAALALTRLEAAPSAPADGEDSTVTIGLASLDALVHASAGDLEGAKQRASALGPLAKTAPSLQASFDARWIALALGEHNGPLGAQPVVAWLGSADPLSRYLERGQPALETTMAAWTGALSSSSEIRRAFRYQVLDRRGDAPAFILPYLVATARLLDDETSAAGVETWLDTASAVDARRLRLRSYVWARAEAAKIRGDDLHGEIWRDRLAKLREVAAREEDAEMAAFLRF